MKNITWSGRIVLSVLLAAAGSGLLLRAQDPQQVGTFAPFGFSDTRTHAASATLADGRTVIVGGFDADGQATASIAVFDPADGSIAAAGELPVARVGHSATLLKDGRVLIAGGLVDATATPDLMVYDPADQTITMLGTMSSARSGHAAARLADGTVLLVGGSNGTSALASAEVFDPQTSAVSATSDMSVARAGASATLLIDNRVLVAGGHDGTQDLKTAEIYYPFAGTWEPTTTTLSVPRSGHAAVLLPWNASVLIAGGSWDNVALSSADLFLPAQFPDPYNYGMGTFAVVPTGMSAARGGAYGGPLGDNGYAFVAGRGLDVDGQPGPNADRYRFATIKTDKDDYAPGEFAVITGSGWQPLETVTLLFQEDPAVHEDYVRTVIADGQGNFEVRNWAPDEHDFGVRFYLTAFGIQSRAQTTFTDGGTFTVNFAGTGTGSVASSTGTPSSCSANCGIVVGNNGNFTITATLSAGSTFGGWSGSGCDSLSSAGGLTNNVCHTRLQGTAVLRSATVTFSSGTVATTLTSIAPDPASVAFDATGPVTLSATLTRSADGSVVSGAVIAFTVAGSSVGDATTGVDGVASLTSYDPSGLNVGSHNVEASFAASTIASVAYAASSGGSQKLTITKADQTIDFATLVNKTYGDADYSIGASATSGLTVSFASQTSGVCTVSGTTVHIVSAGTCTIRASQTGDDNYNAAENVDRSFTVNKTGTTTTVTCGAGPFTYNGLAQEPCTAKVTGAAGLDQAITVGYTDNVNAGTATATATYAETTNYFESMGSETFEIQKAAVTATAGSGSTTYDGGTHAPSACTFAGFSGSLSCANNPATVGPTADTYPITPVVTGADLDNFIVTPVNGSYTIAKAATTTTVTCGAGPFTYNGLAQEPCTAKVTGAAGLDQAITVGYTDNVNAGTATATATYAETTNYFESTGSETFEIQKAAVTATAGSGSTTYDAGTHAPSACTFAGFSGSLSCANNPATVGPTADTYPITPVVTGADLDNFIVTPVNGSYTIAKAATTTTVTCGAGPFTYNGLAQEPCTAKVTGAAGLDQAITVGYTDNVNAGTATATATYAETTNYFESTGSETFEIQKAAVTATAGSGSTTYDAGTHAPSACTFAGFSGSLSCANNPATVGPTADTYPITPVVTGADLDNFIVTPVNGSYTIAKAATTTTVTCGAGPFTYNGLAQEPCTAKVTGAAGLDQAITVGYTDNVNAGTATATATYAETTNYFESTNSKTFGINKALLTITASSHSVVFNSPVPTIIPGFAGFVAGDDSTDLTTQPACTTTYTPGSLVGTTPSTSCSGATAANYSITPVPGTVTILTACSAFNGFLPPIGGAVEKGTGGNFADPVRAFKLNSTIPVKFTATCFGAPLTTGVQLLQATKYSNATDSEPAIDATPTDAATTGNQFRVTGTEWHFNLSTKGGMSQGTWLLKATLFDGSTYSVWVSIKK